MDTMVENKIEPKKLAETMYQEHKTDFEKMSDSQVKELIQSLLSCAGIKLNQIDFGSPSTIRLQKN